jgi:hypothetical protein
MPRLTPVDEPENEPMYTYYSVFLGGTFCAETEKWQSSPTGGRLTRSLKGVGANPRHTDWPPMTKPR